MRAASCSFVGFVLLYLAGRGYHENFMSVTKGVYYFETRVLRVRAAEN